MLCQALYRHSPLNPHNGKRRILSYVPIFRTGSQEAEKSKWCAQICFILGWETRELNHGSLDALFSFYIFTSFGMKMLLLILKQIDNEKKMKIPPK